jgi:ornithine cyclodeaminase
MLVLDRGQVEALLDIDALITALGAAMVDLSAGRASVPDRVAALVGDHDAFLAAMPGYLPAAGSLMTKLVSLFPGNTDAGLPTHQGLIVVFDAANGRPTALLDATAITAARTGACSALSARLLARPDARVLAVIGTGVQARSHITAMRLVRQIAEIRVAGRDPARAAALAAELRAADDVEVRVASSYQQALDGADIACATTHSTEPVIRRIWLTPGVHVTSVGYNRAGREVDDATVRDALVCVESRRAALAPFPAGSNDLLQPITEGVITADHIHAEIGELLTGAKPARTCPQQITLYKSVGVAVQDAAAAALVITAAEQHRIGTEIAL